MLDLNVMFPSNCSILSSQEGANKGGSWMDGGDPPLKSFPEMHQTKPHICCNCYKKLDLLPSSVRAWWHLKTGFDQIFGGNSGV